MARKKKKERKKQFRLFVSDIHSNIDVLKKLDQVPELQEEDSLLVFCGDYIDGYNQSKNAGLEVLRYVKDKVESGKAIALMGNHDEWLWTIVRNKSQSAVERAINEWSHNGMIETLSSWGFDPDDVRDLGELLKVSSYSDVYDWIMLTDLPYFVNVGHQEEYFRSGYKVYAVHAGVDLDKNIEEQSKYDLVWIREEYIEKPHYLQYQANGDFRYAVIVSGHTPNQLFSDYMTGEVDSPNVIRDYSPTNGLTRYFIDAGSKSQSNSSTERLNLLVLNDEGEFIRSELLTNDQ